VYGANEVTRAMVLIGGLDGEWVWQGVLHTQTRDKGKDEKNL
jgi:hypothetical protein